MWFAYPNDEARLQTGPQVNAKGMAKKGRSGDDGGRDVSMSALPPAIVKVKKKKKKKR
jgi:hypothetical protein